MRTFNFLVLALLGFFFASCGSDDDHLGDWAKASQFAGSDRLGAVSFVINDVAYVGLGYGNNDAEYQDFWKFDYTSGSWTRINDFPGEARHAAVAFVIGNKAYVGSGYRSNTNTTTLKYYDDFWEFDPVADGGKGAWSQIDNLPVKCRDAVAFANDKYGYVGTGRNRENNQDLIYKDFYKFDPKAGAGQQWKILDGKSGFIGDKRYGASAFVVGGYAYVCLGTDGAGVLRDMSKFDFTTETWTPMGALTNKPDVKQDKDYDRIPRAYAITFISDKGKDGQPYAYVATGMGGTAPRTVWRYNHNRDQWHQMEDLSYYAANVTMGVGFAVGGYGYYTTGGSGTDEYGVRVYAATWKFIPDVKEDKRNDY